MNRYFHIVKLSQNGKRLKIVYCCPSRRVAQGVLRELRMVRRGNYAVEPCQ